MTDLIAERPSPRRKAWRPKRAKPYGSILSMRLRNIRALMLREFSRKGEDSFGHFGQFVEPLCLIIGLTLLRLELHPIPPLGTSFQLFFLVGAVPFYAYQKTEQSIESAMKRCRPMLNFTVLSPIDIQLSQFAVMLVSMLIFFNTFLLLNNFIVAVNWPEQVMWPEDVLRVYWGIVLAATYGLVMGILNASIEEFFPPWDRFSNLVRRLQYIMSGKAFLVDSLPTDLREIFSWNPLLHLVELSRSGFYYTYESRTLDLPYFYGCLVVLATIAFAMDQVAERKRSIEA